MAVAQITTAVRGYGSIRNVLTIVARLAKYYRSRSQSACATSHDLVETVAEQQDRSDVRVCRRN